VAEPATNRAIDAVWRIESARLIAGLTRIVRDVGLAEDLAQDALVAALERWPRTGVPDNPGAWLMAAAKFRAIDAMRRDSTFERKRKQIGRELDRRTEAPDLAAGMDDVGDVLLGLVLMTCHPVLSTDARVALTLRLFGGLTTEEIARAFLVPEATVQQRVVRAKRTLAAARVPFEIPRGEELSARLPAVLRWPSVNTTYSTWATETTRSGSSPGERVANGASSRRSRLLARLIRWAIVASGTRNARAIWAVVRPPTARRVRATWLGRDRSG